MRVSDLQRLYDYGEWANGKLFEAVAKLTPEQFIQPVAGSYGSIRNTLVHILSAQWGWLDRSGGHARGAKLNPGDYPTVDSLLETWRRVDAHTRVFLAALQPEDLTREVEFAFGGPARSLPVGEVMQHAAVHAVHHRGQIALMLRMLGVPPGDFDLLLYPGRPSVP